MAFMRALGETELGTVVKLSVSRSQGKIRDGR